MKYKITMLVEGTAKTLKDLEKGYVQSGIQRDVLDTGENILKFSFEEVQTDKTKEHSFLGDSAHCAYCGCDQDDAFVGGEECEERCNYCGSALFNDKGECEKCGL